MCGGGGGGLKMEEMPAELRTELKAHSTLKDVTQWCVCERGREYE